MIREIIDACLLGYIDEEKLHVISFGKTIERDVDRLLGSWT